MRELCKDKTVPSLVRTNQVATNCKPKNIDTIVNENRDIENSGSIIDVMDSLIRMFDPDYKDEENFNTEETTFVLT